MKKEIDSNANPLVSQDNSAPATATSRVAGEAHTTFNAVLLRLISLCVLPLLLLAIYLAIARVMEIRAQSHQQASLLVRNFAAALDQNIEARISGLQVMAASPLVDEPIQLAALYRQAQGFRSSFGGEIVLADRSMQMLLNTGLDFGAAMPKLPRPRAYAAASITLASGKPAVGDVFPALVTKEPHVALVVPVIRSGETRFLLLNSIETARLQQRLDELALPDKWVLTVFDSSNGILARRAPAAMTANVDADDAWERFVVKSAVSPWSVVLEIPRAVYLRPIIIAAATVLALILVTTMISVIGGRRVGHRLVGDITAQKLAEEKLRLSEESLSITLRSIGDAVIATDAAGLITRMNPTAEHLTGWSLTDATGRPLTEVFRIVNTLTRKPSIDPVQLVMERGDVAGLANHTSLLARDGNEYQIFDSAAPIRNAAGDIVGMVLVFSDVTETYSARQTLASTADLLVRIGEMAKVGGWELDLRTMQPYWSLETCRIHEVDPPVAPALDLAINFYAPEARPIIIAAVDAAIKNGTPWDLELPFITAKGRPIWVRTQCSVVWEGDTVTKLLGAFHDITERKRTEAALLESEGRYRAIVEWSPEPIAIHRNGKVIYVNPAAIRLFGASSAKDLIGKSVLEFVHADSRQAAQARMALIAQGGVNAPMIELKGVRLDGTAIEVEIHSAQIVYGGEPATHATMRDITARKQTESALRDSEAFNLAILDSVTAEIAVLDRDGVILAVNQPWQRFASENSVEPGVIAQRTGIGTNYLTICDASTSLGSIEAATARAGIEAVLSGVSRSFGLEYPCHSKEQQRWFSLSVTPLGPDVRGAVVSHTDITERKQAELARAAIIDASLDAIITIDESESIVVFNGAAEKLFQFSASEAIGQTIDRFIPVRFRSAHHAHLRRFGQSGDTVRKMGQFTKLSAVRKDGLEFPIEASISHIVTGGSHLFTVTMRDITEREQAESARVSLEAQLRESQKMEAIGTLAGGIAHDFNNILATILGNTELARQDANANPRALESLDEIRKASARARDLVQQILSFSRRQPTLRKRIALAPIIEESARLLRATLPARLTLNVYADINLPLVLADATQIEQIVINLCTNAMQAIHSGPGRIDIRLDKVMLDTTIADSNSALKALREKYSGPAVRLAVSDDGPGMDATTLERIFEPFFTTKPVDEGTGLGLSVVHGIVQAHDGVITVDSLPGKGTIFTLYLPAAAPDIAENTNPAPTQARTTSTSAAPPANLHQHILYLDDDEALVFLVQRLIERRGYRLSGFIDQHEAIDAVRADPFLFDLAVTDYNMPGMSGLDVARAIRAIRADLPVAVASGFIDEALRAQAEEAGVRELIFKASAAEDLCEAFVRLAQTTGEKPGDEKGG